jgi:hypothetical protein
MGKKGKKAQAGKPKKPTPKDIGKRLDVLTKNLEEELKGADLFAPLPPTEDCAICLVPLSRLAQNSNYWACCGNIFCNACNAERQALIKKQNGKNTCPFCRGITSSEDEYGRQLEARALKNDHNALRNLGYYFKDGSCGLPKDDLKALVPNIGRATMKSESVIGKLLLKVAANLLSIFSREFTMPMAKFPERKSSARTVWIAFIESVMTL